MKAVGTSALVLGYASSLVCPADIVCVLTHWCIAQAHLQQNGELSLLHSQMAKGMCPPVTTQTSGKRAAKTHQRVTDGPWACLQMAGHGLLLAGARLLAPWPLSLLELLSALAEGADDLSKGDMDENSRNCLGGGLDTPGHTCGSGPPCQVEEKMIGPHGHEFICLL